MKKLLILLSTLAISYAQAQEQYMCLFPQPGGGSGSSVTITGFTTQNTYSANNSYHGTGTSWGMLYVNADSGTSSTNAISLLTQLDFPTSNSWLSMPGLGFFITGTLTITFNGQYLSCPNVMFGQNGQVGSGNWYYANSTSQQLTMATTSIASNNLGAEMPCTNTNTNQSVTLVLTPQGANAAKNPVCANVANGSNWFYVSVNGGNTSI
jgi:hypothetical protein